MRTIGLIGGMSWVSTAEYYRLINQAVAQQLGALHSARIVLVSVDFAPVAQAQHDGRWDAAAAVLVDAAQRLQAAGADCIVLCTNTMHKLADRIAAAVPLPFLHIADATGAAARASGLTTVGLLATGFTMEQPFLRERLEREHGLRVLVPDAPARADVHRIIYEELCKDVVTDASRARYLQVIDQLTGAGAQAILLGCTEIALLVKPEHTQLPLLDTTALHAHAAVNFALAQMPARKDAP
ncbi:aspartate/glutamate racemase family protein [Ramlibacter sp.]|uniref:aspartate/glutamate racemase family protein n=1 Tax=Ramlibacter sp. TaxID=1917967 RepID=UPI0017CBE847|nr:aspartate/glutamate racemase family protein [Ramlibacter sp.]MBA2672397.1 aspartate/glutamate racemase family protein [Ramlibacter sp.]